MTERGRSDLPVFGRLRIGVVVVVHQAAALVQGGVLARVGQVFLHHLSAAGAGVIGRLMTSSGFPPMIAGCGKRSDQWSLPTV